MKNTSCRYTMESGQKYLVFTYMKEGKLATGLCLGNTKLKDEEEQLKLRGKGKTPKEKPGQAHP